MVAAPSLTYSAVGDWGVYYGGSASACTAMTIFYPSPNNGALLVTATGTPLTTGHAALLTANATTNARIYLQAAI